MIIKIALILSIVLQFVAAVIAISLLKKTKFNITWILVSMALGLMAIRRVIELIPFLENNQDIATNNISNWLGIAISIIIALGMIYIKKIFRFIESIDRLKTNSEKRVLSAIIKTEEKERKHFAKELHDGLGPLLSSIKMSVSGLSTTQDEEKKQKIIRNIDTVTNEAITSIKEISNSLSPHILNNFGLYSAIEAFSDKINASNIIELVFSSNIKNIRFDFNVETILYRVVCELINNTLKHASAKKINIDINIEDKTLSIYYFDDGIGFDVEKILSHETTGMGYSNIITRLKSINGKINASCEPNTGLHININVEIN